MTAVIYRLVFAWDWLMGLRFSTEAQREHAATQLQQQMDATERAWASSAREAAAKREAQRLLAIISEPLKDWDLADFPSRPTERLTSEDNLHLERVVRAYQTVAPAAAQARMSVVFNDQVRSRGYGDRDLPKPTLNLGGVTGAEGGSNLKRNMKRIGQGW